MINKLFQMLEQIIYYVIKVVERKIKKRASNPI